MIPCLYDFFKEPPSAQTFLNTPPLLLWTLENLLSICGAPPPPPKKKKRSGGGGMSLKYFISNGLDDILAAKGLYEVTCKNIAKAGLCEVSLSLFLSLSAVPVQY